MQQTHQLNRHRGGQRAALTKGAVGLVALWDADAVRFLDIDELMRSQISSAVPDFDASLDDALEEVVGFVGLVRASRSREAIHLLTTQAMNDFVDLLHDLQRGRGRPALRAVRSLFDCLLAVRDVVDVSTDAADRYEAHGAVTRLLAAEMDAGLSGLSGNALRAERHARKKAARASRSRYEKAIATWGPNFRRGWASGTTRDRADRHGLSSEYDLFRVSSASIHATAGGALGHTEEVDGQTVHRIGPALSLCSLALGEGVRLFHLILEDLAEEFGLNVERASAALNDLLKHRNTYAKALASIDKAMWPSVPPIGCVVLRALLPDGTRHWVLHDNSTEQLIRCNEPEDAAPGQIEAVEALLDNIEQASADVMRDEWITAYMVDATAEPLPGASWRSERHILPSSWLEHGELVLPWDQ